LEGARGRVEAEEDQGVLVKEVVEDEVVSVVLVKVEADGNEEEQQQVQEEEKEEQANEDRGRVCEFPPEVLQRRQRQILQEINWGWDGWPAGESGGEEDSDGVYENDVDPFTDDEGC